MNHSTAPWKVKLNQYATKPNSKQSSGGETALVNQTEVNCVRFSLPNVTLKYPAKFRERNFRDQREKKAIIRSLKHIPFGSNVLDIPSGSGRLTQLLLKAGFHVTASDRSLAMLQLAEQNLANNPSTSPEKTPAVTFCQADVLNTEFSDNAFDSVICHRLFHHLIDSDVRKKAIKELDRICNDTMIISFFDASTLSAYYKQLKRTIFSKSLKDRIPIPKKIFIEELNSQGLEVIEIIPVLKGISPLTLVVAKNRKNL